MSVMWEDPPRIGWAEVVAELQQQPGRWARVLEPGGRDRADNARRRLTVRGCEAVTHKVDGYGVGVWARWPA